MAACDVAIPNSAASADFENLAHHRVLAGAPAPIAELRRCREASVGRRAWPPRPVTAGRPTRAATPATGVCRDGQPKRQACSALDTSLMPPRRHR
jgi:hypothetical protein